MSQLNRLLPIIQKHQTGYCLPLLCSVSLSLRLKHQIVFSLSLDLPSWHPGSIMVGEQQAATQETLTQEGSMISLSDKQGIQLEDTL